MAPISINRLNVSCACTSCKILKIKCDFVASTTSTAKCTQCIKRNRDCIFSEGKKRGPRPKDQRNHRRMKSKNNTIHERHIVQPNNELICDLPQDTIKILSEVYPKERLSQIISIFASTSSHTCPLRNVVADHHCHEGCIVVQNTHNI
ncbi:hypothetical protein F8M41_010354 [Gigaspora margarita]|uniref:Zn(2)-C6 fungal-type domain-containing protein n=1 Tax=Gigaspora margarita TaxID=4874 RepID=A0A8H4AUE9_GIGMA|nr:hypothetical protein F8M41_010354 [Gigaspora margarita]